MNDFLKQIYIKSSHRNNPVVFLDRDGTINKEVDFLTKKSQIRIFKNAIKAIKIFNDLNFIIIVITNQPVIARGWTKAKNVEILNNNIFEEFKKNGAKIHAIYTCPHHPNANILKYRLNCECRKPGTLMVTQAIKKYGLKDKKNMDKYFIIGDKTSDIEIGKKLGITTVLVKTGYKGLDKKYNTTPDFVCSNIYQAAKLIEEKISNIRR